MSSPFLPAVTPQTIRQMARNTLFALTSGAEGEEQNYSISSLAIMATDLAFKPCKHLLMQAIEDGIGML